MSELSHTLSQHTLVLPPSAEDEYAANTELTMLLVQCSQLSAELSRVHALLKRLAQRADSRRIGRRTRTPDMSNNVQQVIAKKSLRHFPPDARSTRSVRSKLERACRIALMETNEPASAEAVFDRIQRRGSFAFVGYKRPLRAIRLVMTGMVKRGEAKLLFEDGHRRWCWEMGPATLERRFL
jgi:hypothetical protein